MKELKQDSLEWAEIRFKEYNFWLKNNDFPKTSRDFFFDIHKDKRAFQKFIIKRENIMRERELEKVKEFGDYGSKAKQRSNN